MDSKGDFFDDKGESAFNVGKPFLIIIADQINVIRRAEREAFFTSLTEIPNVYPWLIELRVLYDLIENQLKIRKSKKLIDIKEYVSENGKLTKINKQIEEQYKFLNWFLQIEKLFEINMYMQSFNPNRKTEYLKNKQILLELSECTRELLAEANKRHLIMPDLKVDMKQLAQSEWIDRDFKKDFN